MCVTARPINQAGCGCVSVLWCFPRASFQDVGAIIRDFDHISEPLSNMAIKHNHANSIATIISLHAYVIPPVSVDHGVHKLLNVDLWIGLLKLSFALVTLTIWWVNYNTIPLSVFIKCKVMNRITDVSIMTHLNRWLKYASDVFIDMVLLAKIWSSEWTNPSSSTELKFDIWAV